MSNNPLNTYEREKIKLCKKYIIKKYIIKKYKIKTASYNIMEKLHNIIDNLHDKYSNNEYVIGRMENYIVNILPNLLETANANNNERNKRKLDLSSKSTDYINNFMLTNKYYYCPQNELFMLYDNTHYISCSEDDIQYKILSGISSDNSGELISWKHKIKIGIIKLIRERSPLHSIPESATIQFVLNLFYPIIFQSRNHVKYFLTVIGDILCGKNDNTYICSTSLKKIINELHIQNNTYFENVNLVNNIKYKYHSYEFNKTRILYINKQVHQIDIPRNFSKYVVDILSVATHYSSRYTSSDKFLEQCNEKQLVEHSLYFKINTINSILTLFINKYIEPCDKSTISNKNMLFVWKKYLNEGKLPNMLLNEELINNLKTILPYDEDNKSFVGVTSKIIPVVAEFIDFWETTIVEEITTGNIINEYEIDEISVMFKRWSSKKLNDVEDGFILELIRHLYVNVDGNIHIDDDKYIVNIKSLLWDKSQEVIESLTLFKDEYSQEITQDTTYNIKSLSDAYAFYVLYKESDLIISKRYFDKVAKETICDYLDSDSLIKNSWFI